MKLRRRIIVGNKLANILDGLLETSDLLVLAISANGTRYRKPKPKFEFPVLKNSFQIAGYVSGLETLNLTCL